MHIFSMKWHRKRRLSHTGAEPNSMWVFGRPRAAVSAASSQGSFPLEIRPAAQNAFSLNFFLMFVPSLSWSTDHFESFVLKCVPRKAFVHTFEEVVVLRNGGANDLCAIGGGRRGRELDQGGPVGGGVDSEEHQLGARPTSRPVGLRWWRRRISVVRYKAGMTPRRTTDRRIELHE
jgi:hypothetical protein